MNRLFISAPFRGNLSYPRFKTVRDRYLDGYNIVYNYSTQAPRWINNNHPLIQLVKNFGFSVNHSDEQVQRWVESNGEGIAAACNITTSNFYGRLHKNAFYSSRCGIISVRFEPVYTVSNWRQLRPVRVLTHPHTQIYPVMPDLLESISDTDYAIVGVDIGMLAVMYKHWKLEQETKTDGERHDVSLFIAMCVYPNMLPEQIDIAIRNRLMYKVRGMKMPEYSVTGPRAINDQSRDIDDCYEQLMKTMNTGKRTLMESLTNMPLFFSENWAEAIPKRLGMENQYGYWASLAIYSDWLYALLGAVDNLDSKQEDVYRKAKLIRRYIDGTQALKYAGNTLRPILMQRINFVLGMLDK